MKRLLLFFLLLGGRLAAQEHVSDHDSTTAGDTSDHTTTTQQTAPPPKPVEMRVIGVNVLYKDTAKGFRTTNQFNAELGDYIQVKVRGLDSLLNMEHTSNGTRWVTLYLNDMPMNLYPLFPSKGDSVLIFRLERDTFSEKGWDVFYDYPRKHIESIPLTVGLDNGFRIPTDVQNFKFEVSNYTMIYIISGILFLLTIGFIQLVRKTPILRDGSRPDAPYSLSRAQLAFWTITIFFAFVDIYAITGDLPELRTSTLILLGISLGTTATARVIDTGSNGNPVTANAPVANTEKSKGFWTDILSDGNGVSIHRLQMVAWTVIFGFYFIRRVQLYLNIPELDDSLLTLMGVSSAAYVGLKVPENKTPTPPDAQQQNPPPPVDVNNPPTGTDTPPPGDNPTI